MNMELPQTMTSTADVYHVTKSSVQNPPDWTYKPGPSKIVHAAILSLCVSRQL